MITFLNKALGKWMKPTTDDGLPVQLVGTKLILPVDHQARATSTITILNAVSIPASGTSIPASWIDTQDPLNPFTDFDISLLNDASTSSYLDLYWSNDGSAIHGTCRNVLPASTERYRTNDWDKSIKTKARWLKVVPVNNDTAAAHIMTVSIFTKA